MDEAASTACVAWRMPDVEVDDAPPEVVPLFPKRDESPVHAAVDAARRRVAAAQDAHAKKRRNDPLPYASTASGAAFALGGAAMSIHQPLTKPKVTVALPVAPRRRKQDDDS